MNTILPWVVLLKIKNEEIYLEGLEGLLSLCSVYNEKLI